ncbi:MAG: PP2C family protein-serine/threonine phosphatase [Flavobacteriales bacterium]
MERSRAINDRINGVYAPSIGLLEELDNQLLRAQQLMKQWAWNQQNDADPDRVEAYSLCTQRIPTQLNRIDSISVIWSDEQRVNKNVLFADVQSLLLVYADLRKTLPSHKSYYSPELMLSADELIMFKVPGPLEKSHRNLRLLTDSQRRDMEAEIGRMNESFTQLKRLQLLITIAVSLIGIFLLFLMTQWIVRPVNSLRLKLTNLSKGIYSLHPTRANNDEIGDMVKAADRLIANFEKTKEFSLSVGAGKFDMPFEPLSEHDELGMALLQMRDDLASYRNEMEEKVAAQTQEIRAQKEQVELQNVRVTELYTDLQASIDYAQRLQSTILPGHETIAEVFPKYFVFYKPKAKVSGDFYWFANKGKKLMFAAADCTGHGVPGAFMSLVGHNALNQATKVYNKPAQVLNAVNRLAAVALRANQDHFMKDGMDIALCAVDMEAMELEFSGAQNPAYVVRAGELTELSADSFSIGSYVKGERDFTEKKMALKRGDCIYLFSDGYADQFGGPLGKKLMRKQFRQILADINELPIEQQRIIVQMRFEEWQGENEQVDDVLVIGVQI